MITISINGEPKELADGSTVSDVLDAFGVGSAHVAVEYNKNLLKKERYISTELLAGDELEIVTFVGGG